jgi:hypothetical protein
MSEKQEHREEQHPTRREVLKKAAYVAPAVLTLVAVPAFTARGSEGPKKVKKIKVK